MKTLISKSVFIILLVSNISFGQKTQKINTIEWDFQTKIFKDSELVKNLKVNDYVQLVITGMPVEYSISSEITFLNNHLELRGSFGDNIVFNKNIPNVKVDTASTKENLEKEDGQIERKNSLKDSLVIEKKEKLKKIDTKDKVNLIKQIEKTSKVNSNNLDKALEINEAEKLIKLSKNNKEALDDIIWQKHLIDIAKQNWKEQLDYRKIIIDSLTKIIAEKELINPSRTHNFTPFKIENYDFSDFTIEITDKTNENIPAKSTSNFNFKNRGGFKLDFSTGVLVSGLYSPSYKIYTSNSKTKIIEEANPTSKFNTGIALLAHAYSRTGTYINTGIGSGFSYNLNSQNLNYLLGASLLAGEEQRFIATFGLNIGKVKELSSHYEINKEYDISELTSNSAVPMVDVLKASWFLSITYNLGVRNPSKKKTL